MIAILVAAVLGQAACRSGADCPGDMVCLDDGRCGKREPEGPTAEEKAAKRRMKDSVWINVLWSGVGCVGEQVRQKALDEIATEKKYAAIGGVQNNTKLYALQKRVQIGDEFIKEKESAFAAAPGVASIPCADPRVALFAFCLLADSDGGVKGAPLPRKCRSGEGQIMVQMWRALQKR